MTASRNLGFDVDCIRPFAFVAISPDVIAIHPSNPAKDLKEFIANAKTKSFTYGSAGVGTGPQIALRFLQALQRSDDLGADSELFALGRSLLATHDLNFLQQIMADVSANAGLASAGRCTQAESLTRDSAVVTCGPQRVVVHVLSGQFGSGVLIADWLRHYDHYRSKHTHAFTTLAL